MAGMSPSRNLARPAARRLLASDPRRVALGLAMALAVVVMLAALSLLALGAGPARADTATDAQKVAVFEDAVVGVDEVWDNVVVVGGDLLVEGTVKNVVVVVGGDLTLTETAQVGTRRGSQDAAIVSVLGDVSVEDGARVRGETFDVGWDLGGVSTGALSDPFLRPWRAGAALNWVWSTIFLAIVALIVAAIAPRQVWAVSDRVRRHFFSSLGWGALGAIIVVPIITVLLIVTIVGILLVIPWLFVALPLLSLFGFVAVGAALGRIIFRGAEWKRDRVMLAAVVGVIILNVLRWIPVGGFIIMAILWFVGFGAAYVAIWAWLRDRRRRRKERMAIERGGPGGMPPMIPSPSVPGSQPSLYPGAPAPAVAPEPAVTPVPAVATEAPAPAVTPASTEATEAPVAPAPTEAATPTEPTTGPSAGEEQPS